MEAHDSLDLDSVKEQLTAFFSQYRDRISFAYLFGSMAKGEAHPKSDLDLAVYISHGSDEEIFQERLTLQGDLCRAFHRNDIDLVVLNTVINLMLLDEILRYGIVVFDRDSELREGFELDCLHRSLDFRQQRKAIMGV